MERYKLPQQEKTVLEHLRQPFAIYQFADNRVVTLVLSDGFCKLFGYDDRAEAYYDMDNNMYKDTHPDDVARIANAALNFATKGGQYEVVYRSKLKESADYRIIHAYGEHVFTDDGVRLAHVWYSDEGVHRESFAQQGEELTESLSNALHENSMVKASHYDDLTGLPNMSYFFELAEAGKAKIRENGETPVLMYMDFSGMKFYNTKHGFAEGDKLLQSFAKILADTFGNERSCRIGADHFAVQAEEAGLDEKLQTMFHECQAINGGRTLPIHVGIYVEKEGVIHTSVACDRAKLACTALRGRYETAVNYYSQELREEAENKQYIIENIDRAIKEKWIQVYFQPIIRAVNERVCDVEALARWIDPEKGVLSPVDFIPALEDARLIYKLDLYMVDQILDYIKEEQDAGFYIIPHSINLSRSDFEACDMVEEIRKRVDEAGVDRALITIEITESVIGSNFEFMKEQVERFRSLGFPVWMDDFGSGYSSLDVLQSIQFDLIKFDMSFMRKLDEGDNGKIILTELMKMATSLGVDTICEGVETEEQVRFLREIGCSKLQGFYYSKPISFETLKLMRKSNTTIQRENPQESNYYERIGQVNLYDLSFLAKMDGSVTKNTFDTVPMCVLETHSEGDRVRYVRSNQSFRDFMKRAFAFDLSDPDQEYPIPEKGLGSGLRKIILQAQDNINRTFIDEEMDDGSVIHSFVRRIGKNPVNGKECFATAVLSITEPDDSATFADIASSLAADYYNIYLIDLDTNEFIEYTSQVGDEEMSLERHGGDFFESARRDTMTRIYEEDRKPFLELFTKENVLRDIDRQGVFTTTYRLTDFETPKYVNMKITRMRGGNRLILGVSIIDAHMKQMEEEKRLRQEKKSLGRIAALSPDFIVLYTVDLETNRYTQYNPSNEFAEYGLAKQGEDFFKDVILDAPKAIAPEDMERHLRVLTKENMISEIQKTGYFTHHYRMIMNGKYIPSSLKATMIEEEGRKTIILGVTNDENEEIRRQMEERIQEERLIYARLHAITGNFIVVYVVDPETNHYREFSATTEYEESFYRDKEGLDFFSSVRRDARVFAHPEDLDRFLTAFTRENVLAEIERSGIFTWGYRILMDGKPLYVQMKAAMVEEKDGPRLIVGLNNIDAQVRQEKAFEKQLAQAQNQACIDALTGVKNKNAFLEAEMHMNQRIAEQKQPPFAIVIFDVNDLKAINDTAGHQAGDQYLQDACKIICNTFKKSPVFRVGGDEFVVIAQGSDYERIGELLGKLDDHNANSIDTDRIVIACGMARFNDDNCVASVFERADHNMYENKNRLKSDSEERIAKT